MIICFHGRRVILAESLRCGCLQVYCGADFKFMRTLAQYFDMSRPTTFLDAGANIGLASLLFTQMMMSNGETLAVDANPSTLEVRCNFRCRCISKIPI
jgi:predicted O-methyltransferase YrrM